MPKFEDLTDITFEVKEMLDFKEMFDYTANVIYKAAIDEEKEWRKEGNPNDIEVMDQLLKQVRALGYRYRYFVDITNRENNDKILWLAR